MLYSLDFWPSQPSWCFLLLPSLLLPLLKVIQCDFTMSFSYFKAVEVCVAAWKMPETSAHMFLDLVLNPSSCSSWNEYIPGD